MIKIILLSVTLLMFSSCSFKTSPNQWQYRGSVAFDSYVKNFLSAKDSLAKNDIKRAIKHAKQSADLTTLSRIYAGQCAINISVGLDDGCTNYEEIAQLVDNESLDAYYALVRHKQHKTKLKQRYAPFAKYLLQKDYKKAQQEIFDAKKITTKLLLASLMRENLTNSAREKLVKLSSYYGYKKAVLFWLKQSRLYVLDDATLDKLSKKISILESD